jgi:nicotinic acid mononucleotide adenylyltransferase
MVVPRSSTGFDPESPAARTVLTELGLPAFVRVPGPCHERAPASSAERNLGHRPAPLLVQAASLPISGSDLRRRAREGKTLAYRLPASVGAYIREHQLYRADA